MQMIGQNDPGINLERMRLRYLANDIFHRVQALRQAENRPAPMRYDGEEISSAFDSRSSIFRHYPAASR
jgi:hypothetical protein